MERATSTGQSLIMRGVCINRPARILYFWQFMEYVVVGGKAIEHPRGCRWYRRHWTGSTSRTRAACYRLTLLATREAPAQPPS